MAYQRKRVDDLGRVVIPKHLRDEFGIVAGSELEFIPEKKTIIVKKHNNYCDICGGSPDVEVFEGKFICNKCIEKISEEISK